MVEQNGGYIIPSDVQTMIIPKRNKHDFSNILDALSYHKHDNKVNIIYVLV